MKQSLINEINSKVNQILLKIGKNWELALDYEMFRFDSHALDAWHKPCEDWDCNAEDYDEVINNARNATWNVECSLEELRDLFASFPLAFFDCEELNIEFINGNENKKFDGIEFKQLADWILSCVDDAIKTIQEAPILKVEKNYEDDTYDLSDGTYIHGTGDGRYYNEDGSRIYSAIIVNHELLGFYED